METKILNMGWGAKTLRTIARVGVPIGYNQCAVELCGLPTYIRGHSSDWAQQPPRFKAMVPERSITHRGGEAYMNLSFVKLFTLGGVQVRPQNIDFPIYTLPEVGDLMLGRLPHGMGWDRYILLSPIQMDNSQDNTVVFRVYVLRNEHLKDKILAEVYPESVIAYPRGEAIRDTAKATLSDLTSKGKEVPALVAATLKELSKRGKVSKETLDDILSA
jgi:hypothetical protein